MLKVEFNRKNSNPFYGMANTLSLYEMGSKGQRPSKSVLEASWTEADTIEKRAVLFSVLFFIGDISGRTHNILKGKVENGGNAQREVFRDTIIPFLVSKTKTLRKLERLDLINLIVEYTTLDNIVATRVVTTPKTQRVNKVVDMVSIFGVKDVASYIANVINKGTVFQKTLVAKFVTRPRFSKRSSSKKLLPETRHSMSVRAQLLTEISTKCNFLVEDKGSYKNYTGFYNWRKEYNKDLESVLFSSKEVENLDREQFLELLNRMPSDARFRVRNRVMFGDKWTNLQKWYKEWEVFKFEAQKEQRVLEAKVQGGSSTEEDVEKLKEVKKKAKVTTGAINFTKLLEEVISFNVDEVKIQPFLDKINLPYNTLVFVDDSGSMNSSWGGRPFNARAFAAFLATVCLLKNPDAEARNLVGLFSRTCRMFSVINRISKSPNRLMVGSSVNVKSPLLDPTKDFVSNFRTFKQFLDYQSQGSMTDISSVIRTIGSEASRDPSFLDELQKFPVWTFVSDGNFNNMNSIGASVADMLRKCESFLGFKPFIILIDVDARSNSKITRFSGIDNIMVVPPNPANIEMLLTNFKDMDTYDVYTPLQSLSRSKRYAPIRNFVEKNLV